MVLFGKLAWSVLLSIIQVSKYYSFYLVRPSLIPQITVFALSLDFSQHAVCIPTVPFYEVYFTYSKISSFYTYSLVNLIKGVYFSQVTIYCIKDTEHFHHHPKSPPIPL